MLSAEVSATYFVDVYCKQDKDKGVYVILLC